MKIEHIAVWSGNIEALKTFYTTYFGATAGKKYVNPVKNFASYFLTFTEGCRLEVMQIPGLKENGEKAGITGLAHFAISVGSRETVLELTGRLRKDGYPVASEPRTTGDGYFESVVLDPDGNQVEITI